MTFPDNVQAAVMADMQDMISWSILLNYFSQHQSELSPTEKITIYEKCEDFRIFWNTDQIETTEVIRNSGEIVIQKKVKTSLKIDKKEIYPNNIYTDTDILEHLQTRNNKHPTTDSGRDTDLIGEAPALAI